MSGEEKTGGWPARMVLEEGLIQRLKFAKPVARAIALAAIVHDGQFDKQGVPYIFHVLRVVQECRHVEEMTVAAALHDVVEDSWVNLGDLYVLGFSDRIVAAVDALTRRKNLETYEAYIIRCSKNPLARAVKMADVRVNMERADELPCPESFTLWKRYREAWQVLYDARKAEMLRTEG